jgi:hypothetical protein
VIEHRWTGGPICILFLDLPKSWKINDAVMRDFFGELQPGSVIVQQDYGSGRHALDPHHDGAPGRLGQAGGRDESGLARVS